MLRTTLFLAVLTTLTFSGCILVRPDRTTGSSRSGLNSSNERDCHPSQYWDGQKCKHKGKGKGARKHDD